jgi:hypothetical protein
MHMMGMSFTMQLFNFKGKISLFKGLLPLVTGVIIISSVFFTGCFTTNSPVNTSLQYPSTSPIVTMQTTTNQTITKEIPITTSLDTTLISPTPVLGPVFTETDRPMIDANGTQILSKVQAWSYAEKYLAQQQGLRNIQASEVTAHDPTSSIDKNKTQTLIWTFKIDRKSSMGFERGGVIAIDAYDGHVVWYNQLM